MLKQKVGIGALGSWWRNCGTPVAQCVHYRVEQRGRWLHTEGYYIQINKETGLVHTSEQGGRIS